ncbi:MAG: hypothetical protein ACXQTI_10790 [Candidatus Nezhaarchaeales archaeon]
MSASSIKMASATMSIIYLVCALLTLANWLFGLSGFKGIEKIGDITIPSDPGAFIALFTIGLVYAGALYYSTDRAKSFSCIFIASALALALVIINTLVALASTANAAILSSLGELSDNIITALEEALSFDVILGVLSIPLLIFSIKELRNLAH